jgi:hypothetical protein
MKCPECGSPLMIANNKFETKTTDDGIEIYSVLTMVCVNSRVDPVKKTHVCSLYAGKDLNNPLKIAATVKNKVG